MPRQKVPDLQTAPGPANPNPAAENLPPPATGLLDTLMTQQASLAQHQRLVHGVLIGQVLEIMPDARVRLAVPALGLTDLLATPVCELAQLAEGVQCALMFAKGDTGAPLIIGPMAQPVLQTGEPLAVREAVLDEERIVLVAEQEIELRCGEASITLTRDGQILLRGQYITDHASATRRIRGGAVQIN